MAPVGVRRAPVPRRRRGDTADGSSFETLVLETLKTLDDRTSAQDGRLSRIEGGLALVGFAILAAIAWISATHPTIILH